MAGLEFLTLLPGTFLNWWWPPSHNSGRVTTLRSCLVNVWWWLWIQWRSQSSPGRPGHSSYPDQSPKRSSHFRQEDKWNAVLHTFCWQITFSFKAESACSIKFSDSQSHLCMNTCAVIFICIISCKQGPQAKSTLAILNSPNSALHWSHVTWVTGWTLRDKCLDNYTCFSVAWVRLGLPMTVN